MQRIGRVSKLKPGAAVEYERLHTEIWPAVLAAIADAGIANYTIFRHGDWLFSYFELGNGHDAKAVEEALARVPECRRWEDRMCELRDPAFAAAWLPMKEVFHLP
jgi:L-rhamnose mutarotase